jgi:hypothetical protein
MDHCRAVRSCRATVRVIRIGFTCSMLSPDTTEVEGLMMPSDLAFFLVVAAVLMLLVIGSCWLCGGGQAIPATQPPRRN